MLALVRVVVQLAKLSRLAVATASSRNAEHLKPLGADYVSDPDTSAELTQGKLHAYDTISEKGNAQFAI